MPSFKLMLGILLLTVLSNFLMLYYSASTIDYTIVKIPEKPTSLLGMPVWLGQYAMEMIGVYFMTFTGVPAFMVTILGLLNLVNVLIILATLVEIIAPILPW